MQYSNVNDMRVTAIEPNRQAEINAFLAKIFHIEQHIPVDKIPIVSNQIYWWGVIGPNQEILGLAATWKESDSWHWGRFCIHPEIRGKGLGKRLARLSLTESFELDIDAVTIDARDITTSLIEQLGGVVCGETSQFFSQNISPMRLEKKNFNP